MLLASSSSGSDFHVYPDGIGGTHATIAEAVAVAVNGDRVLLAEGVFSGPGNRDITVFRNIEIRSNGAIGSAVIDCGGSAIDPHRAFLFEYCAATLHGVTITGGYSESGGAISIEEGNVTVSSCFLRDNLASDFGGAVDVFEEAQFTITSTVFDANSAGLKGGAVFAHGNSSLDIGQCTFLLNGAPEGGHLFFSESASAEIDRSILVWAYEGMACDEYYGGTVTVSCSDVWGNQGGNWSGPITGQSGGTNKSVDPELCDPMAADPVYGPISTSQIWYGSTCGWMGAVAADMNWEDPVYGVSADGQGMYATVQDAFDNAPEGAQIALEDGVFSGDGNRLLNPDGKAFRLYSRSGNAEVCILDADANTQGGPGFYRVLSLDSGEGSDTVFEGITFRDGESIGAGALVRITGPVGAAFRNCTFEDGYAWGDGGAIHIDATATAAATVSFTDCTFNDDVHSVQGGAIHGVNWNPDLDGCTFASTYARSGGALYISGFNGGTIRNCEFDGCEAGDSGGAMSLRDGTTTSLEISGCIFDACDITGVQYPAFSTGGGIHLRDAGSIRIVSCEFTDCGADSSGGDISAFGNDTDPSLIIETSQFSGGAGQVPRLGGSIYALGIELVAEECVWTGYEATRWGGTLGLYESTVSLTECRIEESECTYSGGAYFRLCDVTMLDCSWRDNAAASSPGAFNASFSNVNMTYCDVTGNTGSLVSAIALDNRLTPGTNHFDHVVIADNISGNGSGALQVAGDGSNLRLDQCTIHGNESGAGSDAPAQVTLYSTSRIDLVHSIISGSQTSSAVGFVEIIADSLGIVTTYCSNIWGNAGGNWTGPLAAQLPNDENISLSPYYCDPVNGVLTLDQLSPCLPENNACSTQIGARGYGCSGTSAVVDSPDIAVPKLESAHPNPFNPTTTIAYELPHSVIVSMTVHDAAGRLVRTLVNGTLESSGRHKVYWNGCDDRGLRQSSGVYFVRMIADGQVQVNKIAMVK